MHNDDMKRNPESLMPYTKTSAKLHDATDWIAGRSILAYGVRVGIRTNQPDCLAQLDEYFPPLWKPTDMPQVERLYSLQIGSQQRQRPYHKVFEDEEQGAKSRSLKIVLEDFERRLKMYVAEMARRRVFVHAGVVGWNGQAILIPGRSYSGKTSLVAALVRAGATYYSDEYAVLDAQGRVHPYPQPLAVRQPGEYDQTKCPVETIGGVTGTKPLPVGLVLVSNYKASARWRPMKLSAGQGVLELLAHTVPARRKPAVVMPTLQQAAMTATILKSVRGEAEATARLLLQGGYV